MNDLGLTGMTKLEIVIGGDDVPAVSDVLTTAGATGYTVLSGVSGLGHGGFHQGRLHFNDREALHLVMTVIPDERAEAVVSAIRILLESRPGVLFASPTFVSRPEYFS